MHNRSTRAFIALALCGFVPPELAGIMPSGPSSVCFIEGEGDDAPAGGADAKAKADADAKAAADADKPTLTQKQFDEALNKKFGKVKKEHEGALAAAVKAEADKRTAVEQQIAELTAKLEDAGKSDSVKEAAALKRSLEKLTQEKTDGAKALEVATAKVAASEKTLKTYIGKHEAGKALSAAKVLPVALGDAVDLFLTQGKVEVEVDEDDGSISLSATVDGRPYDDIAKAAVAWLETKPAFRSHPGGGTGTRNGGGAKGGLGDDDMDVGSLLERGFAQQQARRS